MRKVGRNEAAVGRLAPQPFESVLIGDQSLMHRPMTGVVEPLRQMGAEIELSEMGTAPMTIRGGRLTGIVCEHDTASAQVKSAVLIAGLYAEGSSVYHEILQTRDHTERILSKLLG